MVRDREILLFELNIIASCNKETQITWFNSLEPEEREIIDAWFKETMDLIEKVMVEFKIALESAIAAFERFIEGLSPIILEQIRKMAEDDDAEDTG